MGALLRPRYAPADRVAGAAGALLLQAGLLFLFLYSMPQISRPVEAGREMIFVFRRPLPPALPAPAPMPEFARPAPIQPPPQALLAPPPAIGAPPSFAVPDLRGFGDMLN